MEQYDRLKGEFDAYLKDRLAKPATSQLYDAATYAMNAGGKRFRPVLVLLAAHSTGAVNEQVMEAALGIELFHNFTLVHDDIMDQADLRRGKATVHFKWDVSTAILSGDLLMIQALQRVTEAGGGADCPDVSQKFLDVAVQVCEGQDQDMAFELRKDVEIQEYIEMIRQKTAILLGYSLYAGARLGGVSRADAGSLMDYGEACGIAFQIWDDYLDLYGNRSGKKKGGDIFNKKQTYLILLLRKALSPKEVEEFSEIWQGEIGDQSFRQIESWMQQYQIGKQARQKVGEMLDGASKQLRSQLGKTYDLDPIIDFTRQFVDRDH